MIDKTIKDFIKVYDNVLDNNLCEETVQSLKAANWEKHEYFNNATGERTTFDDDLSILWDDVPQKQEVQDKLYNVLERYILEDTGYPWFDGWRGYSSVRFNKYGTNTKMNLHCDHIHDLFGPGINGIPILSMVGLLNNDYEGGEFVMWDTVIDIPAGSVLVFPSVFLYPHLVKPVISGTRYSFVSWTY